MRAGVWLERCQEMKFDFYRSIVRPLLFRLDPELAHGLAMAALHQSVRMPWLLQTLAAPPRARRERELFGLRFPSVVGLAAGLDKNAVAIPAWIALGFGFVEVGTVTALAQPGNPKPRIFRLPELEALINRLGFNNDGAEQVARRLAAQPKPAVPLGINLGKSKATPLAEAAADYLASFRQLLRFGDYFVLNVSSPNTPGLRQLQDRAALAGLLAAVQSANPGKPLLIKIAPDLTLRQIDEVVALALEHRISGLIATNTTIDQAQVPASQRTTGGLSGRPLCTRSREILRHLKRSSELPVISVGGIASGQEARARLDEGADLIQVYTGFIYRGPALLREIERSI